MGSRTETRLERHRLAFRHAKGTGPLILSEDLDPEEIALVNSAFMERIRRTSADDIRAIYVAYVETLHSWGIMCPHPQKDRLYEGFHRTDVPVPFDESRWYSCDLCGTIVINRS